MSQSTTHQPPAPATHAPLVLVLAGTRNDHGATTWAAQEAARRHRPLVLVSLLEARSWSEPTRATADHVAAAAARRARRQEPAVEVRVDLAEGDELRHAGELSLSAELLVVGVDRNGTDGRTSRPSALDRLLGQTGCPVVALSTRAARDDAAHHDVVVVGWSGDRTARRTLDAAAAEAASRRARLSVLAVLAFDVRETNGPSHERRPEPELVEAVADAERRHPGLVIDVLHRAGGVFSQLEEAGRHADLLIVGAGLADRRGGDDPGDVVDALARLALCPVLVVPTQAHDLPPTQARDLVRDPASDPLGRL